MNWAEPPALPIWRNITAITATMPPGWPSFWRDKSKTSKKMTRKACSISPSVGSGRGGR